MEPRARERVVVIGAGLGGLAAALPLAARGLAVTIVEAGELPGGKARALEVGGQAVASGPTVCTLLPVIEAAFEDAGACLADHVRLTRAQILARHAWHDGSQLDLHADPARSEAAIAAFAGAGEARAFRAFLAEAARIHRTLGPVFLHEQKTMPSGLSWRLGARRVGDLLALRPYTPLWTALCGHFRDPRLVQLFARYATYAGASPFQAPATLMLIAHVEAEGVWLVEGGIAALAGALAELACRKGASIRYGTSAVGLLLNGARVAGVRLAGGEILAADHVVFNGDPSALAEGALGAEVAGAFVPTPRRARSLSAFTLSLVADCSGFPLSHHNVFFSRDYRREFAALRAGAIPEDATIYICAEDRPAHAAPAPAGPERLLAILNAPAFGDVRTLSSQEIDRCTTGALETLARMGLKVEPRALRATQPSDFARRFPGTGGAIYGRASHGPTGAFRRPGARTRIAGLFLAGGGVHPGAGVPMVMLSGRLAAEALLADRASMSRFGRVAMPGGMSMPSPPTGASASP
ncbi:MAG: 1-hydroxycarotenoid 3,4-desaturase CrtD [Sphingomonadaceae bacterium]